MKVHTRQDLTLWAAALVTLLGGMPAQAADAGNPADTLLAGARTLVGSPAPALQLESIDGATLDLGALRGDKAVYLKFWATWCGPCRAQMPHFENVYRNAGEELEVIAINTGFNDTLDDIEAYREELGIHMPVVVDDGMLAGAFNLRITPQHIVIGKDGLVKHIGNTADAELDAVLAREGKAPDIAVDAAAEALAAAPRLDVGDRLPAAKLNLAPTPVALEAATARGTVIVFMTPWCESYLATTRPQQAAACREVREQLEAAKTQHPDLRWLGIASGIWTLPPDLDAYARDSKVTVPLALDADGSLFRRFGVLRVPTLIVADATGRIVSRVDGSAAGLGSTLSTL